MFPGGIGGTYDEKRGEVPNYLEWARHLLKFFDGRFERHRIWSLYTNNVISRRETSSGGGFFLRNFLGSNPPTLNELKERIKKGDTTFISKIQHFSSKMRGSPAFWRQQRHHLTTWMNYHAEQKHGPPTLFLTFSCAENHWSDLADILAERTRAHNPVMSKKLRERDFTTMTEAARDYSLTVAKFQKRPETWLETVGRKVFKILYHWGAYEFAKGRGVIHIHLLAIADNMDVMRKYYELRHDKEAQLKHITDYARNSLFMTAEHPAGSNKDNIAAPEGNAEKEEYIHCLKGSYSECTCIKKDLIDLINSSAMHFCNDYCLRLPRNAKKKSKTRYVHSRTSEFCVANH